MPLLKTQKLVVMLTFFMSFSVFAADPFNTLTDLGLLNGGNSSVANGVNADGNVVVGNANDGAAFNQQRAFRWTQATGIVSLGTLNGGNSSVANGVNADGNVVVGSANDGAVNQQRAFRWTQATGIVSLGTLNGGTESNATGVNADGNVVVGDARDGAQGNRQRAFRWTQATGIVSLGTLNNGNISVANGVNADGNVVVGNANDGAAFNQQRAFRWTQATGIVSLGTLNAGNFSSARAVNSDGSVIVGSAADGAALNQQRAFRWTQATGIVSLDVLNGGNVSVANDVNSDGSVVVGTASDGGAGNVSRAFRWTQATGLQKVEDWLRANGVNIPTDVTSIANGVSPDGTIVVGQLANNDAFIARANSGLISLSNLNESLFTTTLMSPTLISTTNMVLEGAHSYPLTGWLPEDSKYNVWVLGDLGKLPQRAHAGAAEVGGSHRLFSGVQGSIGLGRTQNKQKFDFGGYSFLNGAYALAEVTGELPIPCLFLTATTLYQWGNYNVYRGYINAGNLDSSFGKPSTRISASRLRLDWKDAAKFRTLGFSPYVEVSTLQGRIDAYTEQQGGFPSTFNTRKPNATNARVGVRGDLNVGCSTKLLATAEGVFNLKRNNPASTGQVIGLIDFSVAPGAIQRRWLKGNVGVAQKIGHDVLSITANATTKGQDPMYWLAASYYLSF